MNLSSEESFTKEPLRHASMFSGIGGFDLALQRVGFRTVWVNDIDKYACRIYRKNLDGSVLVEGDIREVDAKTIPDHDLLTAGFPCQAFSIAGKRKATQESRGTLWTHILRVIAAKRPKLLLLENVKGILSAESGRVFALIIRGLENLGYWYEWQVLNSKHFGVPQNRERVFIIGHLGTASTKQVFSLRDRNEVVEDKRVIVNQEGKIHPCGRSSISERLYGTNGVSPLLMTQFRSVPIIQEKTKVRRLTPIECERLQGFPDNWTEGVSDTQRYKLLGNAVTVNVIEFLGQRLREAIDYGIEKC